MQGVGQMSLPSFLGKSKLISAVATVGIRLMLHDEYDTVQKVPHFENKYKSTLFLQAK